MLNNQYRQTSSSTKNYKKMEEILIKYKIFSSMEKQSKSIWTIKLNTKRLNKSKLFLLKIPTDRKFTMMNNF